jgi:FMN-dependent oxidoreductase (nitrilotriacetate monooxygenase family)
MSRSLMNIGLLIHPYGNHPASWLFADAPSGAEVNIDHYINVTKIAESGALDFVFFADVPAIREGNMMAVRRWPLYAAQFEPITLLGALAAATSRIGLAATASTSYSEPYNIARQFASLDHLSHGRVGWNVVTTSQPAAAYNFGRNARDEHAIRYERAREFLSVVTGLWDSWEDDAFSHDKESASFFDPKKLHRLDFVGKHVSVRGPLNVPRPPQGHPVIIQAGGSEPGKALAAETAEVVFTQDRSLRTAQAFYADVKGRLGKFGRSDSDLKILSGLNPILGRTQAEAEDKFAALQAKLHPDVGREILSIDLDGVDLSDVPLDSPIPESKLPSTVEGGKSYLNYMKQLIADGNVTVRQLYSHYAVARGGNFIVGSPAKVADLMEEWFTGKAADGFMIGLSYLPSGIKEFVELVIPELRRRKLFRESYDGRTFRDHLGLQRPVNRHRK